MFNIGFAEFMVIGVVALIVIGPKQLPEVARVVGRLLSELKRATQDLSGGLLEVTNEVKSSINETKQGIVNEGHKIVDSVTNIDGPDKQKQKTDDHHSEELEGGGDPQQAGGDHHRNDEYHDDGHSDDGHSEDGHCDDGHHDDGHSDDGEPGESLEQKSESKDHGKS